MSERTEALLRIVVGIVGMVVVYFWRILVQVVIILHWIIVIITGKRNADLAKFTNYYTTFYYNYLRYITFATNKRVFPFEEFGNVIEPVDMKTKPAAGKKK